jgi:hypothetical protein
MQLYVTSSETQGDECPQQDCFNFQARFCFQLKAQTTNEVTQFRPSTTERLNFKGRNPSETSEKKRFGGESFAVWVTTL